MEKIATTYDVQGEDQVLRRDIAKIKNAINQILSGDSGTFTTVDGKTVTVTKGIVTSIA